jgi:chromosome segregation ATPase
MNELDERVAQLEASAEKTDGRVLNLERDVGVLKAQCASRTDLAEAKAEILVRLAESENTLRTDIVSVEHRLRTEINASENKLKTELNATENKLKTEIAGVENRLTTSIVNVREGLRTEIAQAKTQLAFWVVGSVFLAQYLPAILRKLGLG